MPLLRVFALAILFTSAANAQALNEKAEARVSCPILLQPAPGSYGFAKAVVVSLWYANAAVERGNKSQKEIKEAAGGFGVMTAMMRATKAATNDFVCAKQPLKPFAADKVNENISTAASFLIVVYDQHIDINSRFITLLKQLDNVKESELMDQISTLEVERGQRWVDLVQPTTLALMLLVDSNRPDEKGGTRWLNINKVQKKELLDWTVEHFPEFGNGTAREEWSDPTKTAELYLKFLNGHRGSDE